MRWPKQRIDTRPSKENDVVVKVISTCESDALKCVFIKIKEYCSLNLNFFSFSFFSLENTLIGSLDPTQMKMLLRLQSRIWVYLQMLACWEVELIQSAKHHRVSILMQHQFSSKDSFISVKYKRCLKTTPGFSWFVPLPQYEEKTLYSPSVYPSFIQLYSGNMKLFSAQRATTISRHTN